jgi:hypothetical protein
MRPLVRTVILLSGLLGLLAGCHRQPGKQKEMPLSLPQGTPKHPHGLKALTVNPGAPEPFTQNDVANYFSSHPFPMNDGPAGQVHVDSLEFMTSAQVSQRLQGVPTGLDDAERVGFATLSGTFVFSGPSQTHAATCSSAYAVFVASTGRLLMDGSLECGKGPRS